MDLSKVSRYCKMEYALVIKVRVLCVSEIHKYRIHYAPAPTEKEKFNNELNIVIFSERSLTFARCFLTEKGLDVETLIS